MASRRLVVANVTLQSSRWDHDEQVKFSGRSFRLVRIGTNGDLKKAEDLVWQWSLKADGHPRTVRRRLGMLRRQ